VAKLVTHQPVWKPAMFGGVTNSTLCGVRSVIRADAADLNVGDDVTCKLCNAILRGDRVAYGKQFLGKSHEEVEAISLRRAAKSN